VSQDCDFRRGQEAEEKAQREVKPSSKTMLTDGDENASVQIEALPLILAVGPLEVTPALAPSAQQVPTLQPAN